MKKLFVLPILLSLALLLSGCLGVMMIPDADSIGESKTFESDGITLLLTDRFKEEKQDGVDAYYVSDFCAVVVMKEKFTVQEGFGDLTLDEYVETVQKSNKLTNVEVKKQDGIPYYTIEEGDTRAYFYFYKGSDAFYFVQFACNVNNAPMLEDTFYLWAQAVEVE